MSDQTVDEVRVSPNFTTTFVIPPEVRAKDIVGRKLGVKGEVRLRPTDKKSYGARTYTVIANNRQFGRLGKCMVGGEVVWYLPVTREEFKALELTENVWGTLKEAKQALLWSVPMSAWGRDHWSTLAYLETCAVDNHGYIVRKRMRCDKDLHPHLAHGGRLGPKKYPTRLKGGELLDDHDDWSCVDDFVTAGLVTLTPGIQPQVRFTDKGLRLAAALRAHKAEGGNWDDFEPGEGSYERSGGTC